MLSFIESGGKLPWKIAIISQSQAIQACYTIILIVPGIWHMFPAYFGLVSPGKQLSMHNIMLADLVMTYPVLPIFYDDKAIISEGGAHTHFSLQGVCLLTSKFIYTARLLFQETFQDGVYID